MKDFKLILEDWRRYAIKEQEEPAPAEAPPEKVAGSWPSKPSKTVKITAGSGLTPETIMDTWNKLAAMGPPKDPDEILAAIGGPETLVANVKALEKNFAGSDKNPARIDMPVVDPDKDMEDLKGRLSRGELDVKEPFAPLQEVAYDMPDKFPTGLDTASDEEQEAFLTKGLRDDGPEPDGDSSVALGEATIDVAKSFPTQSEVYLDKSLWNILNFGPTPVGGVAFGDPNLIAIQDGDQNFILDGHHRWSSAWISGGPQAQIRVQALTGLNIPEAIAALRSYGNARDNAQKSEGRIRESVRKMLLGK